MLAQLPFETMLSSRNHCPFHTLEVLSLAFGEGRGLGGPGARIMMLHKPGIVL
jgi:hypothetical protein